MSLLARSPPAVSLGVMSLSEQEVDPPAGVVVRPARSDDLAALANIEVAAGSRYREVGMHDVADDEPPPDTEYWAAMDAGLLWVAEVEAEGRTVGYAWAVDLDGQPHLEQLSVLPEVEGHGIGSALLEVVARWAAGTGAGSLTLSTFREVPWNSPWYARRGFEVLPAVGLDSRLLAVRHHEAERGLDVDARVVMRRTLPEP
jgi:GNAT superfamily N-acetyltransferase